MPSATRPPLRCEPYASNYAGRSIWKRVFSLEYSQRISNRERFALGSHATRPFRIKPPLSGQIAGASDGADERVLSPLPSSLGLILRFEPSQAPTARCRMRLPQVRSFDGKWNRQKNTRKSMACEVAAITSACYLCNTRWKTSFIAPFRSVLLLCVQGRSVIVAERRRGASRGRPV